MYLYGKRGHDMKTLIKNGIVILDEIKSTTIGKRERMGSGVIWTETGPWRSTPGWTENTM